MASCDQVVFAPLSLRCGDKVGQGYCLCKEHFEKLEVLLGQLVEAHVILRSADFRGRHREVSEDYAPQECG